MVEKPTLSYARECLVTKRLPHDDFLTAFGIYCVDSAVFEYLDSMIENNIRQFGLIQFTDALEKLRQSEGLEGVLVNGLRHKLDKPVDYVSTLTAMAGDLPPSPRSKLPSADTPPAASIESPTGPPGGLSALMSALESERALLSKEREEIAKEREEIAKERGFVRAERERLARLAPSLTL